MTAITARVQRLERTMATLGLGLSRQQAVAAIQAMKGELDCVWHMCHPCLAELQDAVVGFARLTLEARRAALELPFPGHFRPLSALVEVIALPPGEPVPERLRRRPPRYDPDRWRRESRKDADRSGYRRLYSDWLMEAIFWCISPDPEATRLREQLHAGSLPSPPGPVTPEALEVRNWFSKLDGIIGRSCFPSGQLSGD